MTPLALPEEHHDRPDETILVVPHAGGGAAVANPLRQAGPPGWLVAGVMFGGRESRFLDEPPGCLADMVNDTVRAATEVRDLTGRPPVLAGQCSGALVAWLAAVQLAERDQPARGLVVVSRSAPSCPGELPDPSAGDVEFVGQVVDLGGVPADVAAVPDLMELLLPALRADFAALAQWAPGRAESIAALGTAALALFAPGDPACPDESMTAWRRLLPDLTLCSVAGSHLLLGENPGAVVRSMTEWLSPTPAHSGRHDRAGND